MGKKTKQVNSVEDIIQIVKQFPESAIFRGENNIYKSLKPRIGRLFEEYLQIHSSISTKSIADSFAEFENKIIEEFTRYSYPYTKLSKDNEYEIITIGQHHGLPTRLLDWTENILVAIYFAVEGNNHADRRIYIYDTKRILIGDAYFLSERYKTIQKMVPLLAHQRIINQSSIFTVHPESYEDMRNLIDKSNDSSEILKELVIPLTSVNTIKRDLSKLGINEKFIYPDIEGVVKYIQWYSLEK